MSDLNVKGNIKKNGNSVAISNPNLLINGDFRVNQRGASSYSTSGNYTVDRWMLYGSSTLTVNDDGTLKHTLGTTTYCRMLQYIEFPSRLAGQTVTLSAKYSTTDSVSLCIFKGTASSVTTLASTTFSGSGIGSVTATIPESLADSDGLLVCLTTRVASTSTTWYYAKLEIGEYATPFSPKPYAQELADCQRYYLRINALRTYGAFGVGYTFSTTYGFAYINFPCPLRTTPTFTYSGSFRFQIASYGSPSVTSIAADHSSTSWGRVYVYYSEVSGYAGYPSALQANNNSSAYVAFDAEMY